MLGFSGRLGATAFISMNITAIITFLVDSSVGFDRYGFDSNNGEVTTMGWEEAMVTILSTLFVATTASWHRLNSTVPLNPVLIPSTWALFCMLIVSLTQYDYTSSMFNGIAVGSYVAMASESRLPKVSNFGIVGCIAGIYVCLLDNFFLGFGGKSGFTAMIGYATYLCIQLLLKKMRRILHNRNSKKEKKMMIDDKILPM